MIKEYLDGFLYVIKPHRKNITKPENQSTSAETQPRVRTAADPLELPFMPEERNFGAWAYTHRLGLFSTVLIFLLMTTVVLSVQVKLERIGVFNGMLVEFPPEPEREQPPKPEDRLREMTPEEAGAEVRNFKMNQDAALDASLRDAKNSNADEIYREANELAERMKAGRDNYAATMRSQSNASKDKNKTDSDEQQREKETRSKGKVTVSYSLAGREAVYLHVPSYTCRNGGEVEVNIVVNRRGEVISSSIARDVSSNDECLCEMALQAARRSRFNVDANARERQQGTINYVFVKQ